MAKNMRVNVDAKINFKTDLKQSLSQLNVFAQKTKGITKTIKGVGQVREKQFKDLSEKFSVLKNKGQAGLKSGEIFKPGKLTKYQEEVSKLGQEFNTLANRIIGANKTNLNLSSKEMVQIESRQEAMKKEEALLQNKINQLSIIRQKSDEVSKKQKEVASKLGIKKGSLGNIEDIKSQIEMRRDKKKGLSGKEKSEIKELEKLAGYMNKAAKETKKIEQSERQIVSDIKKHEASLQRQKAVRRQTLLEAIKNSKKLNLNEKKKLSLLITQGEEYEKMESSVKKLTIKDHSDTINKNTKANKKHTESLKKGKQTFLKKITAATMYYMALRLVRRIIGDLVETIKKLDKSLTQVAMVTNKSRKEAWQLLGSYQELAMQVGATTDEIAELSVYFFRQGKSAKDALELTKAAAIAAKVASIDATDSADYLTSAINGFGLAAEQAMEVSDKFAALGASSASSYEEMAVALSKVAPSAKVAGVSIDFMMGMLAKGIETTREAPENIGTAFKTIFARMTQIKDFGATIEDGMGLNQVEEALGSIGVALRNSEGEFRDMDTVLTDIGVSWGDLTREQQSYVATAMAGTRQQSRLLAVFQDFDRTLELVNVSQNAAGATLAQHTQYAGGMEAALARMTTAWEAVILAASDSEFIIGLFEKFTNVLIGLAYLIEENGTQFFVFAGILTGVVLGAITAINAALTKTAVLASLSSFGISALIGAASIGGVAILASSFSDAGDASKKLSENVKQNSVDLYNLTKETSGLETLIDNYEKLDGKVVKSNKDLEEMESILSDIQKYNQEIDGQEVRFEINGELNEDARLILNKLKEEKREAEKQQINFGETLLTSNEKISGFDTADRDAVKSYLLSTLGLEFEEMNIEEQESILNIINKNFKELSKKYREALQLKKSVNEAYQTLLEGDVEKRDDLFELGRDLKGERAIESIFKNLKDLGLEENFEEYRDLMDYYAKKQGFKNVENVNEASLFYFIEAQVEKDLLDLATTMQLTVPRAENIISDELQQMVFNIDRILSNNAKNINIKSVLSKLVDGSMSEDDLSIIKNSFPDIDALLNIGEDYLNDLAEGLSDLSIGKSIEIAGILEDSGLSIENMREFFDNLTEEGVELTPEFISSYIEGLRQSGVDVDSDLINQLFGVLTGGFTSTDAVTAAQASRSTVEAVMKAQKEMIDGTIKQSVFEDMKSRPWAEDPKMWSKFLTGDLTAEDIQSATKADVEKNIKAAIDAAKKALGHLDEEDISYAMKAQEIASLENILENIDDFMYGEIASTEQAIEDMYQAEIDFLQTLNEEKKKEIDLIQQKADLNKNILDLDRQIRALEGDTSYGAQARLENLEEEKTDLSTQRQKFVMDLATNARIKGLEAERDEKLSQAVNYLSDMATGIENLNNTFKDGIILVNDKKKYGQEPSSQSFSSMTGRHITYSME